MSDELGTVRFRDIKESDRMQALWDGARMLLESLNLDDPKLIVFNAEKLSEAITLLRKGIGADKTVND